MEVFNTLFIQFAQNDHLFNIGCHAKIQVFGRDRKLDKT